MSEHLPAEPTLQTLRVEAENAFNDDEALRVTLD